MSEIVVALIGIITSLVTVSLYLAKAVTNKNEGMADGVKKVSHESVLAIETMLKNHDNRIDSLNTKVNKLIEKVDEIKTIAIESRQKLASAFNDIRTVDRTICQIDESFKKFVDKSEDKIDKIKTEVIALKEEVILVRNKK